MTKDLPYRPCVGVMVLNRDNQVFVGQRLDNLVEAWQMPQGGMDPGEEPLETALRELAEETSITSVAVLDEIEDWLTYDLPQELIGKIWGGKYRGQRQKWFAMRFTGPDREIDLNTPHPEFAAWKWAPMPSLPDLIVPFKRDLYRDIVRRFAHLAG